MIDTTERISAALESAVPWLDKYGARAKREMLDVVRDALIEQLSMRNLLIVERETFDRGSRLERAARDIAARGVKPATVAALLEALEK